MDLRIKTTTQLLDSLRDVSNRQVWDEFDRRYRPILFGLARRLGLGDDDADEVAQRTLAEFSRDYGENKYDRSRGRLRSWILGIARHRICDLQRENQRRGGFRGESAMVTLVADEEWEQAWHVEHSKHLAELAWNELRESTRTSDDSLEVFRLVAVQGLPAGEVAVRCGVSAPEVYRIKHRLTKRLREIISSLSTLYEEEM